MMQLSVPIYKLKHRAKQLARSEHIPLHEAQKRIAREEGFNGWSALAAWVAANRSDLALLPQLVPGDTVIIGARAGHGKTLMGLRLLLDAIEDNRRAVFFTLEWTKAEVVEKFAEMGVSADSALLEIVTSSEISAEFITLHLAGAPRGSVAVVDYLQILDQQRTKPILGEQMLALKEFAVESGVIFAFISQIDRSFGSSPETIPQLSDVRFPNPVEPEVFSKTCFLHEGKAHLRPLAHVSHQST